MFPIRISQEKLLRKRDFDTFGAIKPKKPKAKPKPKTPAKKPSLVNRIFKVGQDKASQQPITRAAVIGGGLSMGGSVPVDDAPPPKLNIQKGQPAKQGWFSTLLDAGLTYSTIRADVDKVRATAGMQGQQLTEEQAMQQVAQNYNIQPSGNSVGSQSGAALDGALKWVSDNILVVGGVVLCGVLLFKESPTSRR